MKKAAVVVVVAVAMLCASVVWAQYGGGGGGNAGAGGERRSGGQGPGGPGGAMRPGGGGMMGSMSMAVMTPRSANLDNIATQLALTDDQKAKLKDILTKSEAYLQPVQQKAAETSQALRAALTAPVFDTKKVVKLATDGKALESNIIDARINTWAQIRAIPLTADQVTKLQSGGMMFGGRNFGGPRGMAPGGANVPPPGGEAPPPPPPGGDAPPPPPPPGE